MALSTHNVEQMARGYMMYQLAKRGYNVQITDSRFPTADLLIVSPSGKYFGIDVKGQSKKDFWRFNEREPNTEFYFAFVFVPEEGNPKVFIIDSATTMELWREYKDKTIARTGKADNIWGLNWTQPHPYEDRFDLLPR
jgi:hypothetical protein